MSSPRITAVLVIVLAVVCAAGVGIAAPPAAPSGTVTIGLTGDPERLVTTWWTVATNRPILDLVYDSLVWPGPDFDFKPLLAERWEFSPDNRTMTFHLRRNVRWHDGQPVTAHDVAFTYNSLAHPDYNGGETSYVRFLEGYDEARRGQTDGVRGIRVIDDYTISFTSAQPFAPAMTRMIKGIMPRHILGGVPVGQHATHPFNRNPVGSGPFKVVEYTPNRHVILEANQNYWGGRPKVARVIFRIAGHEALFSAWWRGQVHAVPVPLAEIDSARRARFGSLLNFPTSTVMYLGLNVKSPYLDDARVRQALYWGLDREQLVRVALAGHAVPAALPQPPGTWAYDDRVQVRRDLARARALLDEAGWRLGDRGVRVKGGMSFEVELWYATDRQAWRADLAAMIETQLREIGVVARPRGLDSPSIWPVLLPRVPGQLSGSTYQIMMNGSGPVAGDPNWLSIELHTRAAPPGGGNFYIYANTTADELFDQQAALMNLNDRRALWHNRLWPLLLRDMPMVPILVPRDYWAVNTRFKGFSPASNSLVNNAVNWTVE